MLQILKEWHSKQTLFSKQLKLVVGRAVSQRSVKYLIWGKEGPKEEKHSLGTQKIRDGLCKCLPDICGYLVSSFTPGILAAGPACVRCPSKESKHLLTYLKEMHDYSNFYFLPKIFSQPSVYLITTMLNHFHLACCRNCLGQWRLSQKLT